ncbi:hypothetical protein DMB66_15960 [Actinoplanes sp. ATCC 53533]|nr:hypothetical protein DMB66_15960 [Actinoplanes sp. ATCC 53533]
MVVVSMAAVPARADTPSDAPSDTLSWVPEGVRAAMTAAKETSKRVKIDDATTETSEFYATPDGKIAAKISANIERFSRDGAWVPIDLTLRKQADGSVAPTAYPQDMRFSGKRAAETGDLMAMGSGDEKITVGWQTALPEPTLAGSKATYPEVMPGVDLVVQATQTGFEQFTVLKTAAAAKYVDQITLPLSGPGVSVVRTDKKGNIRVHSRGGEQHTAIPTPMMWDSRSATHGGPPKRRQVTADITHTTPAQARKGRDATDPVNLTLKPDKNWLTSPDTVYPVTIDPYYDWSTTAGSTTVVKGYATGWPDSDSLFVGTYDSTWTGRSFISWWATGLQGFQVDQATLHLANPYSTTCSQTPWEIWTTDPITADTSWTNQPEWQVKEATSTSTSCNDGWVTADATSFFQRAVEKQVGQPTMGLRTADETATNQYKQFSSWNAADSSKSPFVEVWYSLPPNPVDPDAGLWANQSTLSDFADWTVAEVGTTSGYIESVNEAKTTSVTLLWAGPPNAMQAAVLAEAQRRTITATVKQRVYTKDQLAQAADAALASATSGSGVFANFTIGTTAAVSPEFDGVIITGQHKSNPADTAAADQALSQQATQALGVAVKVQTAPMPTNTGTTRGTDTSPFNAGAYMAPGCTLGFGLRIGSATYTTTARHCDAQSYSANDATVARKYGTKLVARDGAARLLTAGGSRLMFYGGYNSSLKATVVRHPSTGAGANINPGDYVCTSGGNSGSHCGGGANMKVIKGGVKYEDGYGITSTILAKRIDGGLAAVRGDSGGPVYRNTPGVFGATNVYAVGMIQAGMGDKVPCGSLRQSTGLCYSEVLYTSINTIIRGVSGSSLVTG